MVTIRTAEISDLKKLASLFDAYRMFYRKDSDVEAAERFLKERMEHEECVIYVAEEKGELLGFVLLYPTFSSTRMNRLWKLNDLYVHGNHRGRGVSKKLIQKAKQLAMDTQSSGLILETEKTNKIGNSLYPTMGFVLEKLNNYYEWEF